MQHFALGLLGLAFILFIAFLFLEKKKDMSVPNKGESPSSPAQRADTLPMLDYDISPDGVPYVMIDDKKVTSPMELLPSAPFLGGPDHAATYAFLLNHLVEGYAYEVINDPESFEAAYMERYSAEDPNEKRPPERVRLHNFGIPDFSTIHPPMKIGDDLVFFAENRFMGYPYRVTVTAGAQPVYEPVVTTR